MSVPSLLGKANECKNQSAEGAMRLLYRPSWQYLDHPAIGDQYILKHRTRDQSSPCAKVSLSKAGDFFYLDAGEFICQSGQMKKTNPAKQDEIFS
jgi:hypothetical protein